MRPPQESLEHYFAASRQRMRDARAAALRHVRRELKLANLLCEQAQRTTDARLRTLGIAHAYKMQELVESALATLHFTEWERAALERKLVAVALRIEAVAAKGGAESRRRCGQESPAPAREG